MRDGRTTSERTVDISDLKSWATKSLSHQSHLRTVLLVEPEKLSVEQFLAKIGTWQKLVELEES